MNQISFNQSSNLPHYFFKFVKIYNNQTVFMKTSLIAIVLSYRYILVIVLLYRFILSNMVNLGRNKLP